MKIVCGFAFCLLLFIQTLMANVEFARIGQGREFAKVEIGEWNLRLGQIVVRSEGLPPIGLAFGRVDLGVVSPLQFQVRDSKGIIPGGYALRDNTIFFFPEGSPASEIALARLGDASPGDEDSGRSGENQHWPLEFLISGLELVREDSRRFHEHSILLPETFEALLQRAAIQTPAPAGQECGGALVVLHGH